MPLWATESISSIEFVEVITSVEVSAVSSV